jgi:hypothetical protein
LGKDGAEHGSVFFALAFALAGAARADKIIVADNGGIAGTGTHAELRESCELYKTMFNVQAKRCREQGGTLPAHFLESPAAAFPKTELVTHQDVDMQQAEGVPIVVFKGA